MRNLFIYCQLLLPTIFLLLSSCSQKKVDKSFPQVNTFKMGEKFIVNLPENHSDGEAWKFDEDHHNANILETGNAIWHGNEKGIYFNFTALKPGMDTLSFALNTYNKSSKFSRFVVEVK